jgi:hypothetical protein
MLAGEALAASQLLQPVVPQFPPTLVSDIKKPQPSVNQPALHLLWSVRSAMSYKPS